MTADRKMNVLYDGSCPICSREIGYYKGKRGAEAINWVDISNKADGDVHPGISRDEAMARFHVVTPEGTVLSGGAAFAGLWRALRPFQPIGWLFQFKPLTWVLDRIYDILLKWRPGLQRSFSRLTGS